MSGKRLLDAARLFNASRAIAKQHVQLRSRQLDVYSQTSTLAKALKNQTDRVTLTAQAAITLAKRLNEEVPTYSHDEAYPARKAESATEPKAEHGVEKRRDEAIPRGVVRESQGVGVREGLEQDHHYKPSVENATGDAVPKGELHIRQEEAKRKPLADGTIPPVGAKLRGEPEEVKEEDVPEGVDVNVFRTARVSRMLGVDPKKSDAKATPPQVPMRAEKQEEVSEDKSQALLPEDNEVSVDKSTASMEDLGAELAKDAAREPPQALQGELLEPAPYQMRESRVPASRLGRLWEYSGLGMSMAFGAVGESLRRVTGGSAGGSLMLSPANMERLVAKLSRMRGAALKLGQMISFQDLKMLPPQIHDVLQRVQDSADYMPPSQRDKVLAANLGADWRDLFQSFDEVPIAAASIGQVHKAVLASTGQEVAVKVQYPGVANSIDSDLNNLSILLTASRLLPKGLYLDKTIANARTELAWECDYIREAECARRFHELLADETDTFTVPKVIDEASGKQVLTLELMHGTAVTKIKNLGQEQRDWVGTQIMRLALKEICEFRFMQTDPNWTNFLFNQQSQKLELLDFGASRDYPMEFVGPYVGILKASAINDRNTIRDLSVKLGYLTGQESKTMRDAHIDSVLTLAEPFQEDGPEVYDFRDQTITDRVRSLIPLMVRERLAPPPEETYSLHRKLSGAFLLCARLGSQVPCKKLFSDAMKAFDRTQSA